VLLEICTCTPDTLFRSARYKLPSAPRLVHLPDLALQGMVPRYSVTRQRTSLCNSMESKWQFFSLA
jgi:hypothetical protein